MPSRSIVPVVTVARRWGRSAGLAAAVPGGRVGLRPQGRVGPVQLGDLRGRAPGEVLLAGLGEQVVAGVVDAVGEVEAGRAFGDQGPVPRAAGAGRPRAGRRRRPGRRRGSRRPPRPARPRAAAAGAGSCPARPRRVRPATASPRPVRPAGRRARHRPRRGPARRGPARAAGGPRRSGSCPQTAGSSGIAAAVCRARPAGSPKMAAAIALAEMRVEKRQRVAGVPVDGDRLTGCGGAFAAQHTSQPPVAVEPLADLLAAGTPHEGQPRLHLGDVGVQRWRAVQQVMHGRVVGVAGVGQVAPGDQPLPGPLSRLDTVFDRLEPAGQEQRTGSAPARCSGS